MCARLDRFHAQVPVGAFISGTARGIDQIGERWAERRGLAVERYPADWKRLGKEAGMVRNQQMVDEATHVVAFWDGVSEGTEHAIGAARRVGKLVEPVEWL